MYRPLPFYAARVLTSILTYMVYPFTVTLTVVWSLGMPQVTGSIVMSFGGVLLLMALVGSAMGLSMGALVPNAMSALLINQSIILIFSFGAGLYANTSTSGNPLVRFISWISPLNYGCELLLGILFDGKDKVFIETTMD